MWQQDKLEDDQSLAEKHSRLRMKVTLATTSSLENGQAAVDEQQSARQSSFSSSARIQEIAQPTTTAVILNGQPQPSASSTLPVNGKVITSGILAKIDKE